MEAIRPGMIVAGWLIMLVFAIVNGTIGEVIFKPRWGEYAAHVYKTAAAVAVTVFISWQYAGWTAGPMWETAAWSAGVSWLVLTVAFEFVFGHYFMGHTWDKLIADYRIWKGRLWAVLLVVLLFAPVVMGHLINK